VEEIKTKVRAFIARFFKNVDLQDDQDFFALGFVNSLFAMQLVLFVEKEFSFSVTDEDLNIDNFKSIDAIVHLVKRKITSQQTPSL
jgi:acyl carrier protein